MRIETELHKEIGDEFEELHKMEVGTEQYKTTVDGLTKLMDRAIEIEKLNIEHEEKTKEFETEVELKQAQMEEDRKDRWFRNVMTGVGIVAPLGVTIWGTLKTIQFEKEGTVTTLIGRAFFNKLMFKK